jgi:hypothetical protein
MKPSLLICLLFLTVPLIARLLTSKAQNWQSRFHRKSRQTIPPDLELSLIKTLCNSMAQVWDLTLVINRFEWRLAYKTLYRLL